MMAEMRARLTGSLEPRDLPHEAAPSERLPQPASLERLEHRAWRVRERPVLATHHPQHDVRAGDPRPRQQVPRWIAEDDRVSRAAGDRAEQALVVGVAAHDPVQHDDVRGLDALRLDRDVLQATVGAAFEPMLAQQPPGLLVVAGRQLDVDGACGAAPEQLDLDLADAASDLQNRDSLEPAPLEERDHSPRRLVESALSVALRHPARELLVEQPVAPARVTAARHALTVPSSPVDDDVVEGAHAERVRPDSLDVGPVRYVPAVVDRRHDPGALRDDDPVGCAVEVQPSVAIA